MKNKTLEQIEIKQERNQYCYLSSAVLIAGIAFLALSSPSITTVVVITVVAGGLGHIGNMQIKKLNNSEKKLLELKITLYLKSYLFL